MLDVSPEFSRAVLIGNARFPNDPERLRDIPAVENNLTDLARLLQDPSLLGLPEANVTILFDRSGADIATRMRRAADKADDTFIVYYAGHGIPSHRGFYLAGSDTTDSEAEFNGLDFLRVKQILQECPARRKILILDCCFSGRAIEMMGAENAILRNELHAMEGTYAIAAAPANRPALAPEGARHTAFTGEFLRILDEGIENGLPVIRLHEVYDALRQRAQREGKLSVPQQANREAGGSVAFALNRGLFARARKLLQSEIDQLTKTIAEKNDLIEQLKIDLAHCRSKKFLTVDGVRAVSTQTPKESFAEGKNSSMKAIFNPLPDTPQNTSVEKSYFATDSDMKLLAKICLCIAAFIVIFFLTH